MAFERPSANTPQRMQKRLASPDLAPGSVFGQATRLREHRPTQEPRHDTHDSPRQEDQTQDSTPGFTEDDVDAGEWTQIPGPTDEEMSDSDMSSVEAAAAVQYQVPTGVLGAEQKYSHQPLGLHTITDVHRRYKGFSLLLCRETATEDADQYVLDGLKVAITTAKSIRLDTDMTQEAQLDLYAFALVIHIWQIVCLRKQHGRFPFEDTDESLCLDWTAYFLSAHEILKRRHNVPLVDLRQAVQYWEERLRVKGGGNQWMKDRWAKDIPQDEQEVEFHRNEAADRYLGTLERHGKTGLALRIIEEEKAGDPTQLRTMTVDSPNAARETCRHLAYLLYSMDTSLLIAIIQGQLPRLAEVPSGQVFQKLRELNEQDYIQPGTYMNCICDHVGLSPTPVQWNKVCTLMLKYVEDSHEYNDLAELVDQQMHPKYDWPRNLAHQGLRRYTEWRSYVENGSLYPDRTHRSWVKYFVDQLKTRMQGQPLHAPLSVPVVEIGFSNDPHKRLRQHRHHESSNYLMNLAEAAFETEYPGAFRLQQRIIYACFRPIQTWLSEIVLTQLAQGYVQGGGGFSHEVAGRSNGVSNQVVPSRTWNFFEAGAYANGLFKEELETRLSARDRRVKAEAEAEAESSQRARKLHDAREEYRDNMEALDDAEVRLKEARDRLYPQLQ